MRFHLKFFLVAFLISGCENQGAANTDWLARTIAIVGPVMVVINWLWDRHKFKTLQKQRDEDKKERSLEKEQEQREREEARKEKVQTTCSLHTSGAGTQFRVAVLNKSFFPIRIVSVELKHKSAQPPEHELPPGIRSVDVEDGIVMEKVRPPTFFGSLFSKTPPPIPTDTNILEPGDKVTYYLPLGVPRPILEAICQLPSENVWISVSSHNGEIDQVFGDRVLSVLRSIWEIDKRVRPSIQDPTMTGQDSNTP